MSVESLLTVAVIVLAVIAVAEGLVLVEMVKQVAQIRQRVDLDDEPEPISLQARASHRFARRDLLSDEVRYSVVLLLSSECAACRAVAAAVSAVASNPNPDAPEVVAVVEGHAEDVDVFLADTGLQRQFAVLDRDHEIGLDTGVRLRPAAVVVRDGVMVEAAAVRTGRQLVHLVERLSAVEQEGELEEVVAS
jgi:thiol-disulfide isomerase/thioredoxin